MNGQRPQTEKSPAAIYARRAVGGFIRLSNLVEHQSGFNIRFDVFPNAPHQIQKGILRPFVDHLTRFNINSAIDETKGILRSRYRKTRIGADNPRDRLAQFGKLIGCARS